MPTNTLVREGTLKPDQEKSAIYIPFTMPSDAVRVAVSYSYTDPISADPFVTGGNTLDIGIFDERGTAFLRNGFRGWCGSERNSFFIALQEATPGFLSGPLNQGEWQVYLGLYKIGPSGCSYQVNLVIETDPACSTIPSLLSFPDHPLPSDPPRALFAPWLRGQIHCHTVHSDGDLAPADLVSYAYEQGFDFLAITDHNTISALRDLNAIAAPGLVLIRGLEVTTYRGHFNVWGISDWIDFRAGTPYEMRAAVDFAHERGALVSCNHPKPFGPPWEFTEVDNYDCIEVWNGPWNVRNPTALEFWRRQLSSGRHIPGVGGSDFHRPPKSSSREMLAGSASESTGKMTERLLTNPTVWGYVPGEATESTILSAIRAGHVALSEGIEGPLVELRAGEGFSVLGGDTLQGLTETRIAVRVRCRNGVDGVLRIVDQASQLYEQQVTQDDETIYIDLDLHSSRLFRAELRGLDGEMRALTNPIYLQVTVR